MQLQLFQDKKYIIHYQAKAFDNEGNYKKDNVGNYIYQVFEEIKEELELENFLDMLKILEVKNIRIFEYITQKSG